MREKREPGRERERKFEKKEEEKKGRTSITC
jgi:hypothetical protein